MGFLDKLFKNQTEIILTSCVKGRALPLQAVSDPTFSDEILGKGIAIRPEDNKIYAPCDGVVDLMFETGHAVNLISKDGAEILIHVGLETVSLKGEGFKTFKKTEDSVKAGDLLIEFDKKLLTAKGFDTIIPMIICNTDSYKNVEPITETDVDIGDVVIQITKN